ncbi:MAG: DUF3368 domain-containing protein [Candidatus Omnitrophica bacterium]|nr:DUF3368 domain-containing protein [Candidatus Omnitrophota bacterium]
MNSSPIISRARIGQVRLLTTLSSEIIIPQAVNREVLRGAENDPACRWLQEEATGYLVDMEDLDPRVVKLDLGVGETEVLSFGLTHPGSEIVIDDGIARRHAKLLGIPFRGTVGIVLLAKQEGLIPAARPLLEQLHQGGLWLDHDFVERLLRMVGE